MYMNIDNQRLKEIQRMLSVYHKRLHETDSIGESFQIQANIEELEKEEKQILKRYDVIV